MSGRQSVSAQEKKTISRIVDDVDVDVMRFQQSGSRRREKKRKHRNIRRQEGGRDSSVYINIAWIQSELRLEGSTPSSPKSV